MNTGNRNYSTISPSAKMLLLLKGYTDIPFMKIAAELVSRPEAYEPDMNNTDARFWARVLHFEERYKSVDQLLNELEVSNILELSSGFSFRGLDNAQRKNIHYTDTDLPGVIAAKQALVQELEAGTAMKGVLELQALNALDEAAFEQVVSRFPAGPLAIVNEGLLMYLGMEEKKRLAGIIHKILAQRGGWWITADVYQKLELLQLGGRESREEAFFREHNIEENKFDSFEAARAFFTEQGFDIEKEAVTDHTQLGSLPYFLKNIPEEKMKQLSGMPKMRVTWRLRAR